jgi:hypothetical protein
VRLKTLGKFGAVVQLAVMLLVQFYAVAPGLARSLQHQASVGHCCGDHVKCGCSAEKIASRTCCCYLNKRINAALTEKPSCCQKSAALEKHADHDDNLDRSTPAFSSIPCGCDPNYSPVTAENIKFIRPYLLHFASVPTFIGQYLPKYHSYLNRYLDPPDPPPVLSILA